MASYMETVKTEGTKLKIKEQEVRVVENVDMVLEKITAAENNRQSFVKLLTIEYSGYVDTEDYYEYKYFNLKHIEMLEPILIAQKRLVL